MASVKNKERPQPRNPLGWTPSEWAELTNLHRTTISRHIHSGQLRVVKVGGRLLIHPDEVDRLLGEADFLTRKSA